MTIKAGGDAFRSWGTAAILVTRGGKREVLELKIKAFDLADPMLVEARKSKPKPPIRRQMVKRDSQLGRELGLEADGAVTVADYADREYELALEGWQQRMTKATVLAGLAEDFEDEEGNPVQDASTKLRILEENGLGVFHYGALSRQIAALTELSEEAQLRYFRDRDGDPGSGDREGSLEAGEADPVQSGNGSAEGATSLP